MTLGWAGATLFFRVTTIFKCIVVLNQLDPGQREAGLWSKRRPGFPGLWKLWSSLRDLDISVSLLYSFPSESQEVLDYILSSV